MCNLYIKTPYGNTYTAIPNLDARSIKSSEDRDSREQQISFVKNCLYLKIPFIQKKNKLHNFQKLSSISIQPLCTIVEGMRKKELEGTGKLECKKSRAWKSTLGSNPADTAKELGG